MSKEFRFFCYLIEQYARYKKIRTYEALKKMDDKKITDIIYSMYEMYHIEAIENAFMDIDSLIETGKHAPW